MSFDLGVWYVDAPMSVEQAQDYYEHINVDWVDLRRRPEFDAFLTLLQAQFPDLRSPDDPPADPDEPPDSLLMSVAEMKSAPAPGPEWAMEMQKKRPAPENSPWAATLSPTGSGIALSLTWDNVEAVAPVIVALAARANLLVYDPQDDRVFVPPGLAGRDEAAMAPPRVRLEVAGNAPSVRARIVLDDRALPDATLPSRREAHRRARALALEHGFDHYEVKDPHSLSQSISWESVGPDDPQYEAPGLPGSQILRMRLRGEDE
jgi:hypothetical protein